MNNKNNIIFLSGGGTLGSVMPLIGIYEDLIEKYPDYKFVWVGTKNGPEKDIINNLKDSRIEYVSIKSGKLRRYFDIKNIIDIFNVFVAIFQSFKIIAKYNPKLMLTAGGFVSVPLALSCKFTKTPFFVHQQDFEVGLANKLMARMSNVVTITLDKSFDDYKKSSKKIIKTGNIIRRSLFNFEKGDAINFFNIKTNKKILLVTGGGTGSEFINNLIVDNIDKLLINYEIIHLTGKDKTNTIEKDGYHKYELLGNEMKMALNIADVVVTRAGFSALTELCALKKPILVIPLPGHQDKNASLFDSLSNVFYQEKFDKQLFFSYLEKLSNDDLLRKNLGDNVSNIIEMGNDKYIKLIEEYL